MFDPFDFDQTERKIDLDKMEVYRIDTPELSEDEIVEIMNRFDERTRENYKRRSSYTFTGPSPMDLPSYYHLIFWMRSSFLRRISCLK